MAKLEYIRYFNSTCFRGHLIAKKITTYFHDQHIMRVFWIPFLTSFKKNNCLPFELFRNFFLGTNGFKYIKKPPKVNNGKFEIKRLCLVYIYHTIQIIMLKIILLKKCTQHLYAIITTRYIIFNHPHYSGEASYN